MKKAEVESTKTKRASSTAQKTAHKEKSPAAAVGDEELQIKLVLGCRTIAIPEDHEVDFSLHVTSEQAAAS